MFRRPPLQSSSSIAHVFTFATRGIRSRVPPRPQATVLCYLDHYGNAMRNRQETTISLIRTRNNKFFLQRIFDDGSTERWPCPGLEMMKGVTSYEHFSLSDIDDYGGVLIPHGVAPAAAWDRPSFLDAVRIMAKCQPMRKFTRGERRAYHASLYGPDEEHFLKSRIHFIMNCAFICIVVMVIGSRIYFREPGERNLFGPGTARNHVSVRIEDFANRHPEHMNNVEHFPTLVSPKQILLAQQSMAKDFDEITDVYTGREFLWKAQHAWNYGHWPKGINE
eukprot:PhM_4_TR17636/c0_g1_i1/m.82352